MECIYFFFFNDLVIAIASYIKLFGLYDMGFLY